MDTKPQEQQHRLLVRNVGALVDHQPEDPRRPGVLVDPFTLDCSHLHDDLRRSHVVDVLPTDVPDAVESAVVLGFVLLVRTSLEGTAAGMAGIAPECIVRVLAAAA